MIRSATSIDSRLAELFKTSATVACIGVLLAGLLIILGWVLDYEPLKSPLSYGGKVRSSVAITFVLSALALAGTSYGRNVVPVWRLGQLLAVIAVATGAITLFEDLSGLDLGLNHVWWQPRTDAMGITFPGPIAPGIAACFIFTGLSSLLFGVKTRGGVYPAQALSLAAALLSLVALLGHTCGVDYLCTLAGCIKVPLAVSLVFLMLCYASLFLGIDSGLMEPFAKRNRAGTLVRRSALLIACLPLLMCLRTAGEQAGLYDQAFGWALFGLCALTLIISIVAWTASTLERLDSVVERRDREIAARQEVERVKQDFVAAITHDLRTPLTSLQATLTLLSDGAYGQLSGHGEKRVKSAESGISRLITLINNLLDIEKMEAGKLSMTFADVNLADLVEQSVEAVQGFAEQQGVSVKSEKLSIDVLADSDRMVQVLVNLLSNAIKFSEEGGEVEIKIADKNDCSEVQVIDHGTGIPTGCENSIFEKYEQAHAPGDKRRQGTGLGLSICKTIVELHGGTIGVRGTEGGGSTFWFRLPNPS